MYISVYRYVSLYIGMYPYISLYLYFYVYFQFSLMSSILKQNHRAQTSFSLSTFVTSYAISKKPAPHNSHYIVSLFNRSPICNPFLIAVVTCYSQTVHLSASPFFILLPLPGGNLFYFQDSNQMAPPL